MSHTTSRESPYGLVHVPSASPSSPSSRSHGERIAAAIAHGGTCVAWFFAPLVVYLVERERSEYASHHALQALLWSAFGTIVAAMTFGIAIPVFMGVHLYAAWLTYQGQDFDYPIVGDVARKLARKAA